jgi:L-serine dehydratase
MSLKAGSLLAAVAPHRGPKLYGSLAATGIGHGTDRAVVVGLMGAARRTSIDPDFIAPAVADGAIATPACSSPATVAVPFDWARDMRLLPVSLPYHPNAMRLGRARRGRRAVREHLLLGRWRLRDRRGAGAVGRRPRPRSPLPYPFDSAAELLDQCRRHGLRISELMLANEGAWRSEAETRAALQRIWDVMRACVARGVGHEGVLPGGLNVRRRAPALYRKLSEREAAQHDQRLDGRARLGQPLRAGGQRRERRRRSRGHRAHQRRGGHHSRLFCTTT